MIKDTAFNACQSFNRYMVECEFMGHLFCRSYSVVLIDTWWNVNTEFSRLLKFMALVLIDTWWNVNEYLGVTFGLL